MNISVPIHKDIGEYREKVVGKLSLRTLACLVAGLAASVAAAAISHAVFGIEVADATLPVMCASVPFWLLGFWRPYGLPAEKFLPLLWDRFFGPAYLTYTSSWALSGAAPKSIAQKTTRAHRRAMRRKGAENREPSKTAES